MLEEKSRGGEVGTEKWVGLLSEDMDLEGRTYIGQGNGLHFFRGPG